MRPWAVETFEYMKNVQACPPGDPNYPCVKARTRQRGCDPNPLNLPCIAGVYSIKLVYELPLVSVNRPGFSFLTFFNRAQEHLADYLEGRAYYEGVVEPRPTDGLIDWIQVWKRIGIYRKLAPTLPRRSGDISQDARKIRMIQGAGSRHHNYIVGYIRGGNPAPWGSGSPIRLRDFIGRYPPAYACDGILAPDVKEACIQRWHDAYTTWKETIYGKLWPYIPQFTREDAKGFVRVFPEPGQPFTTQTAAVSIPHLPRLKDVSTLLKDMLTSRLLVAGGAEETPPYEGLYCPAGPWYLTGAACTGAGGGCGDITPNCNAAATATDSCVYSKSDIENLALSWGVGTGNNVALCYNDVVARAQSAGVSVPLTMLIWLNESNASNYNISRQDFGVNDPALECSFNAQITAFLNLPDYYRSGWSACFSSRPTTTYDPNNNCAGMPPRPMTDMEIFLAIFRSGTCDSPEGKDYACGIIRRWNWVSSCSMPSYP